MPDNILPRNIRVWVYGIAIPLLPLLVFYGVISENAAPLWLAAIGGVLTPGLALANVPKRDDSDG